MVLTVSFVLSLVSRACCHRRLRDVSLIGLISASGYQDHTTSPSASGAFVSSRQSVHRIPRPTFVTIAKRPSGRVRDSGKCAGDLPDVTSENACDTLARRANHFVIPEAAQRLSGIHLSRGLVAKWIPGLQGSLGATRHCEERSDEAIQDLFVTRLDCFAALAMTVDDQA
jgi:hypothetical protein